LAPFWRLLLALLLPVISTLAFMPTPPQALQSGWDKLDHLLAFAALAVCARAAFPTAPRGAARVALALLGYGVVIELVQSLIPNRSADWRDLIGDGVGIAIG